MQGDHGAGGQACCNRQHTSASGGMLSRQGISFEPIDGDSTDGVMPAMTLAKES